MFADFKEAKYLIKYDNVHLFDLKNWFFFPQKNKNSIEIESLLLGISASYLDSI